MKDPYDILGIRKDANAEAIKSAYRALAKRLHPDVNPGNAETLSRFKEITSAYDFLSDANKRQRYDRGEIDANGMERHPGRSRRGAGGPQARARGDDFNGAGAQMGAEDLFEMFAQARRGNNRRRGEDVSYSLTVDFIAAAAGSRRRIELPDQRTLDVHIPPGTGDGAVLRLRGQGHPGARPDQAGDAYIEIHIEPHPFFEQRGRDIHLDVPVTLMEAVLGATITVPTIHGPVSVKIPANSNSGSVMRLKGRGISGKGEETGDQYVKLIAVLPPQPNTDLAEFLQRWGPGHNYAVRAKLGVGG